MGGDSSKIQWEPPEVDMSQGAAQDVDYHIVSACVSLDYHTECCNPFITVTVDFDTLYEMLGEQYTRGYHMLHFTRSPGNMRMAKSGYGAEFLAVAFFRKNTESAARGRYSAGMDWALHVEKTWIQAIIEYTSFSTRQTRTIHTTQLVQSIQNNTQAGQRLVSVLITGQTEQSAGGYASMHNHFKGVDLFFEVPQFSPAKRYVYHIGLVPVEALFTHRSAIMFPDIHCEWTSVFNGFLREGWRLIDIIIDLPILEQLRTPQKQRNYLCAPTSTSAMWILEKPESHAGDSTPRYEGTIVEHEIKVKSTGSGLSHGIKATPEWDGVIRDMGHRGWELACVVESHRNETSWGSVTLKSLLFFQRPVQ